MSNYLVSQPAGKGGKPSNRRIKCEGTKSCIYGLCRSGTRLQSYKRYQNYYFIQFPQPCLKYRKQQVASLKKHMDICARCKKCDEWVKLCGSANSQLKSLEDIRPYSYICSLHFEGESGPTEAYPDPIPLVGKKTRQQVNELIS